MRVLISVISHGQRTLVQEFLLSLDRYLTASEYEVVVCVTNNLEDLPWDEKFKRFSLCTIQNISPKGFGDNHNSAFSAYDSDFFFIVNPDIFLCREMRLDWLIPQIPQDGLASPCIVSPSGDVEDFCRTDPSLTNIVMRKIGIKTGGIPTHYTWIAGMFMMFRSNFFRAIKGFDTRYFMYVEDCDLCKAIRLNSGELRVVHEYEVIHAAQRASNRLPEHLWWHVKSLIKFWLKPARQYPII